MVISAICANLIHCHEIILLYVYIGMYTLNVYISPTSTPTFKTTCSLQAKHTNILHLPLVLLQNAHIQYYSLKDFEQISEWTVNVRRSANQISGAKLPVI